MQRHAPSQGCQCRRREPKQSTDRSQYDHKPDSVYWGLGPVIHSLPPTGSRKGVISCEREDDSGSVHTLRSPSDVLYSVSQQITEMYHMDCLLEPR